MWNRKSYIILIILTVFIIQALSAQDSGTSLPYKKPQLTKDFNPMFHFPPVDQGTTNACWSFSTLSFFEIEMQRLNNKSVKLAVMFPVYYAFIEKAKKFVETKGISRFMPGDLFSTVVEIVQSYGIVPEEVYHGQAVYSPTYDHERLENDIEELKEKIKESEFWDENKVLVEVKKILDKYLGEPPSSFEFRGEAYTPKSFAEEYLNLPWDDYIMITSFSYAPFYSFIPLEVPDNWRHIERYFNVPLDVFYQSMKSALIKGYSIAIDSDTSEPGRVGKWDVAFIPEYDIPGQYINQTAREYRFEKGITTDDHLMHIVGFKEYDEEDWFLVKDSWRTAWEGNHKGYFFFHGDYIRLKVLAYLVHKDGVPEIIDRIQKYKHNK